MDFDDKGEVQKMTGDGNARVVETSESSETTVTGRHVEMVFNVQVNGEHKESLLDSVVASGDAVAADGDDVAIGGDSDVVGDRFDG